MRTASVRRVPCGAAKARSCQKVNSALSAPSRPAAAWPLASSAALQSERDPLVQHQCITGVR
ncbi:MAG: hypothetical protein AB7E73_07090 [Burkholderiales bacterium]